MPALKILVHDWSGHPFQVELSRELARRGFVVQHVYFSGVQGPKGPLQRRNGDPANFTIIAQELPESYAKYDFLKRWSQERRYARDLAKFILKERPDVVLSSNTPLDVQRAILRSVRKINGAFVFWLQDIISVAMEALLRKRYALIGLLIARRYAGIERSLLRGADQVICICDHFASVVLAWGVEQDRCEVIENWASREEIVPLSKQNDWAKRHNILTKTVFLYAGTLSIKHDPSILLELARANAQHPSFVVIVASEGPGADWLGEQKRIHAVDNLIILPFQPYEVFGQMLASADVLVTLIEPFAAQFSVPSKALSYLAAGRALLLSAPKSSFLAHLIEHAGAGLVVSPGAQQDFLDAANTLASNDKLRQQFALNARKYAERKFDIHMLGDRFQKVIEKSIADRQH